MSDILQEFIEFLSSLGLQPHSASDIKADGKRKNFRLWDDKAGKKSGFYKVTIEGDFGYGYAGNYKTDECHSFSSKGCKTYSKTEIDALRLKSEQDRLLHEKEIQETYVSKSKEVQEFLFFLERCNNHPYLTAKGLPEGFGALHSGDSLIIPMVDFDRIWSYQKIKPDGSKEFYFEAKKAGLWYHFEGTTDIIYICEGFSTGATVHMATGATVLAAFDAGNMIKVVEKVLGKYPDAQIIIAADNDHETTVNGKKRNTGLEKAQQISAKYPRIKFISPEFESPAGASDFNDLYMAEGIEEVKRQLRGEKREENVVQPTKQEARNDEWRNDLIITKDGIDKRSTVNASIIVENDERLAGVFKYDAFSKQILITRCPPWMDEKDFFVRPVQDYDYIPLECFLEREWRLKVSKDKCADLIMTVAQYKKNTFNPAKNYFEGLKWDKVPRLSSWLKSYVSDGQQPDKYLSLVGTKFLCGLAARAMYPGVKFDTMVIFEGEQYAGKSFLSRIIATIHGEEYFLDDFKDIDNKDALMKMQGKLVVEFPEISTMRKSEVNDLKAFISRQSDEFRPPYGRNTMVAPRQCVFIGTVNPEGPYFRDMTGNRRYWPISCAKRLKLAQLKEIMPQLHAEAAHLVKTGEQLWLDEEEYQIAKFEQDKRIITDLWVDKIEDLLSGISQITTDDLLFGLSVDMDKRTPMVFNRIHQVMHGLGWVASRIRVGGKQKRGFIKIDKDDLASFVEEEEITW